MELAFTAFLVGLFSGVHCVAMCGGVLGALNLRPQRRVIPIRDGTAAMRSESLVHSLGLQLFYSAGRIGSYAVAGSIVGAVSATAAPTIGVTGAQVLLGVGANVLLILLGLHLAGFGALVQRLESMGRPLWKRLAPIGRRLLPADTPMKALAVGSLWGWLPCALVYSALGMAFMSGGAFKGGMVMAAFGLGTLPNLVAAGFALERLRPFLERKAVRRGAGIAVMGLGSLGLARIPALSGLIERGLLCFS